MRFGIHGANAGSLASFAGATAVAQAVEDFSIDSVWAWEQIAIPHDFASPWPYSADGKLAAAQDIALMDPLVWLAYIGARAPRVQLATGVFLAALHEPVTAAKALATLDLLSAQRLTVGIGVGWLREEFAALGVDFDERGKRTDDTIGALRTIWRSGPAQYQSETVSFPSLFCEPRPARDIPIVIAGGSVAAAKRAGRLGDGFYPHPSVVDINKLLDVMRISAEEAQRDPTQIELIVGGDPTTANTQRAAELGASQFLIDVAGSSPASLGDFLSEVMREIG